MIKRLGNLNVILTAIIIVSALVLMVNMIPGQASIETGSQVKGVGTIQLNGSEVLITDYGLMESDPSLVESIRLEVQDDRVNEVANILVTADGGENWESCKWVGGVTWLCRYSESSAPHVQDIQHIEIIING